MRIYIANFGRLKRFYNSWQKDKKLLYPYIIPCTEYTMFSRKMCFYWMFQEWHIITLLWSFFIKSYSDNIQHEGFFSNVQSDTLYTHPTTQFYYVYLWIRFLKVAFIPPSVLKLSFLISICLVQITISAVVSHLAHDQAAIERPITHGYWLSRKRIAFQSNSRANLFSYTKNSYIANK